MTQQTLSPSEMLSSITEAATRTVQDQTTEVQRAAARLGTAVSENSGGDHTRLIREHREAQKKLEGMTEILKLINGFRAGHYVGVRKEKS